MCSFRSLSFLIKSFVVLVVEVFQCSASSFVCAVAVVLVAILALEGLAHGRILDGGHHDVPCLGVELFEVLIAAGDVPFLIQLLVLHADFHEDSLRYLVILDDGEKALGVLAEGAVESHLPVLVVLLGAVQVRYLFFDSRGSSGRSSHTVLSLMMLVYIRCGLCNPKYTLWIM